MRAKTVCLFQNQQQERTWQCMAVQEIHDSCGTTDDGSYCPQKQGAKMMGSTDGSIASDDEWMMDVIKLMCGVWM